jgi:histidyl-tRNA synthetase
LAETGRYPAAQELQQLLNHLHASGIRVSGSASDETADVVFDPTIMRGFDYYTGTVFEIYDRSPENRRALFGGGRYDNLVGLFGNQKLSGVGFGMGDVTFRHFLEVHGLLPDLGSDLDVFVSLPRLEVRPVAESIARSLRQTGRLNVVTALSVEGFGAQLKGAAKLGARWAVLLGEAELAEQKGVLKDLRSGTQKTVLLSDLAAEILSASDRG